MLNTFITGTHNRLRSNQTKLGIFKQTITETTAEYDANTLNKTITCTTAVFKLQRHHELQRKLNNTRHYREVYNNKETTWVKNILNRELTDKETCVLSEGLNYNTRDANRLDFIAYQEHTLNTSNLEENTMDNIGHQVSHHLFYHQ